MKTFIIIFVFFNVLASSAIGSELDASLLKLSIEETQFANWSLKLIENEPSQNEIEYLKKQLDSDSQVKKMVSSLLLYKYFPNNYFNLVYEFYSVHDHKDRESGNYNLMRESDNKILNSTDELNPRLEGKSVHLLLVFNHFKTKNKWIMENSNKISIARFFRGAYFNTVIGEKNSVDLASKIDSKAIEEFSR